MNRFLLFTFDTYYPNGGAKDLKGSYKTLPEAALASYSFKEENIQIYDVQEGKIVLDVKLEIYGEMESF